MLTKTRITTGDIQRELGLTRARLDRILRDWSRELPEPEIVAATRLWPVEALDMFRAVLARDEQARGR